MQECRACLGAPFWAARPLPLHKVAGPLPGALIEVWQANHAGLYDTNKPGNFTDATTFQLRGMLYTNEKGHYEIETILPGRYPVPPNLPGLEKYAGLTRPAHIHFRIMDARPGYNAALFQGRPLPCQRSMGRSQAIIGH